MRVLVAHNAYREPGGEDRVAASEVAMLAAAGHEVRRYDVHNDRVAELGPVDRALTTIWSREARAALADIAREFRPDVVHFHNTFPLISPAAYGAAASSGAAVVQSLHNWRMLCVRGDFFRGGACYRCLDSAVPWRGAVLGCYRESRAASAAVAGALAFHRVRGTWQRDVDAYIVSFEEARARYARAGVPAERVFVKPHFLDRDPGVGPGDGGYALFVGRLAPLKGIGTLLRAWEQLGAWLPLRIVGDGPLAGEVRDAVAARPGLEWLGARPHDEVLALMRRASVRVFPSECLETFGMTTIEAFAAGLPVVRSRLDGVQAVGETLVEHGRTGLHFRAGDADDLARQVRRILDHPDEAAAIRLAARAEFEARYTAERNYPQLLAIYEAAMRTRRGRHAA